MEQVNSQRQQDELLASMELVASAATDEVLVAAAKSRDRPAFAELFQKVCGRCDSGAPAANQNDVVAVALALCLFRGHGSPCVTRR